MRKILIVDDEHAIRRTLCMLLESEHYEVVTAVSAEDARAQLAKQRFDLVILDLRLGDDSGIGVLKRIRESGADAECIIMTAFGSIENAVESMRLGAYDYLTKPINPEELILRVKRVFEKKQLAEEVSRLRDQLSNNARHDGMVAASPAMRGIIDVVQRIGSQDIPVLIRGETGTGKELIARAIHDASRRSQRLFLPINCCALPEQLLDSELFGHVKGAFTGATASARGVFQQAHGGTLFLDEIGDISLSLQTKLLRVLQERTIRQVGGDRQIDVDVRIISATNRDLEAAVRNGSFRSDLFFRLNVLPLHVPPLRERIEDLTPLIDLFVERIRRRTNRRHLSVTAEARARLHAYHWPGNARQLENIIERGFALSSTDVIDVPQLMFDTSPLVASAVPPGGTPARERSLPTLEEQTLRHIREVLAAHDGNQVAAARALGISRTTLRRRLCLAPDPDQT